MIAPATPSRPEPMTPERVADLARDLADLARRLSPAHQRLALLDVGAVAELLAVHPRSVWRMVASGELPKPIRLSERVVRWRASDLEQWIADAPAAV